MASPARRRTIGRLAVLACAPATVLAIAWPAAAATGSAVATSARVPSAAGAAAPGSSAAARPPSGYVDVSVATVWTAPTSPRPVDHPAQTNPVNIPRWLAGMSLADKLGLTDDNLTQTQALYGSRVYILAEQAGWDEVAVPGQVRITAVRFGLDYWGAERFLRPVAAQRSSPAKSPRSPVTWAGGTSGASMLRLDL